MEDIYLILITDIVKQEKYYYTSGRNNTVATFSHLSSAKAIATRYNSGKYTHRFIARIVKVVSVAGVQV